MAASPTPRPLAALWTEVCLVHPALDAITDGFEVYPVVDCVAGTSREAHEAGLRRLNLTGFRLASPPGTPTPVPARIVGVIDLVAVLIAALALYVNHLSRAWRGIYIATIVLAVYLNAFVGVVRAFQKIGFLRALAPTAKEPPFLVAQLLTLALFVAISMAAFKRLPIRTATEVI